MRTAHLRQADLNLLVVFTVLAEERNVTRAASRLLLSQPAVSRAFQRLRDMFHDDLLIRTPTGYEPTPKGQRLLQELESTLPRLDRLMTGTDFDPTTEEGTFRVAATDYAALVICPLLCRSVVKTTSKVAFDFVPLHEGQHDALDKGRLDLLLSAEDGTVPTHLAREVIFEVDFVCVVSKQNKLSRAPSLKQYLAAEHVGIDILGGIQTIPEQRLAAIGEKRHCPMVVAYHTTAMKCVMGTNLVATVPRSVAELEGDNPALKILKAPPVLGTFKYLMAWHTRMNSDAGNVWLRSIIRDAGRQITLEKR
jgi:DNA-binding transcriptional LysR family regulator